MPSLIVRVVFHRSAFRSNPEAPRYARVKDRHATEIRVDPGRKLIPGRKTRIEGLMRKVLAFGYEFGKPVVHVTR